MEDLRTETRFRGEPLLLAHGILSGVSLIIPGREQPFGILSVHSTRRRTFGHNFHFLQTVATLLATTIERRRAEEQTQLQQAELTHMARLSMAGELAAGLAHELNQPLTAITANTHACLLLLRSEVASTEKLVEVMEEVRK